MTAENVKLTVRPLGCVSGSSPSSLVYCIQILAHYVRTYVLLEKLTDSQLVKKFPAFYGTLRFITLIYTCPSPFPILSIS